MTEETIGQAVTVLIIKNGLVLAVSRGDTDLWGIPGGKVEPTDATTEDAALRELLEETGLYVDFIAPVFTKYVPPGLKPGVKPRAFMCTTFLAAGIRGEPRDSPEGRVQYVPYRWLIDKSPFREYNAALIESLGGPAELGLKEG